MVKSAPANADRDRDAEVMAELEASAGVPVQRGSRIIGVTQAMEITGLSERTIQRRVDLWLNGDRSDQALKGGRAGGHRFARRYVDHADAEALAAQIRGELPAGRHPQEPAPGRNGA